MTNAPAKILVVDDAPLIRGLLVQVLQKYGYAVDTAEDGQQALEYFIEKRPDLILMDADMPVMDGVAACSKIRALPEAKYLPIIIVTAFVEREWVDRAYAAGATDYVTKPVNWDVLRNRIHYILQAKHAEEALFEEKEKAQVTLASIGDGVITTDADGKVEYLNFVAAKLTGWQSKEAHGLVLDQVFSIIDETNGDPLKFPIERCLQEGKTIELSVNTVLIHRDQQQRFAIEDSAAPIRDRSGNIIGVVLVFHDVTENRKMTQELSYKAKHDALTGLYNLHEFKARLSQVLQTPPQPHTEHALLYMDLDRFKIVNDTCGHEAGDQLLKDVALIFRKRIDAHNSYQHATLARIGGDEFGLLLEHCALSHSLEIADYLREGIQSFRFYWGQPGQPKSIFTIGVSIGLVPVSKQIRHYKSILAMADAACYAAKNGGRNNVHIYQEDDEELLERHKEIQWFALINDNLERDDGFVLYHQPIQSLNIPRSIDDSATHSTRYEILLRMTDPEGKMVAPGAFLSTAVRYNLMPSLDRWVVHKLLNWLSCHPEHLAALDFCSVNVSGYSLGDKELLESIETCLKKTNIPAHKLCFELNEATAITNLTSAQQFIQHLKALGCRFALDNFGSGMSSFDYLKSLPVDFVKIEGSLIKALLTDEIDYAVVKCINEISHLMGIKTIAEAVETEAVYHKLQTLDIDYVQGYWLGKPEPLR